AGAGPLQKSRVRGRAGHAGPSNWRTARYLEAKSGNGATRTFANSIRRARSPEERNRTRHRPAGLSRAHSWFGCFEKSAELAEPDRRAWHFDRFWPFDPGDEW